MDATETGWLERYLHSLSGERRLSPHTGLAYRRDLYALHAWLTTIGIARWADVDSQHVRQFAAECHRAGLAPRSIQRRLSAIRGLYAYLAREGLDVRAPATDVRAPKGAKRLPKTLDVDQMARLLEPTAPPARRNAHARDDAALLECRDRAIVELLYSSGLRLAELVGLDLVDVDLKDHTARVLGKGAKVRIVPVGKPALRAIADWLKVRSGVAKPGVTAMFVGRNGERVGPRAVQQRVAAWARRQGLGIKLHPHLFRHSFASHLLESSGDLRGVQELLGHANISTTQIYTHLDFQHLARTYDASHPRARRRQT